MNNWCNCWFFTRMLLGILIFKGLTSRRLYKSFGVKGLMNLKEIISSAFLKYSEKLMNSVTVSTQTEKGCAMPSQ
jgi:hypothetical protein